VQFATKSGAIEQCVGQYLRKFVKNLQIAQKGNIFKIA
jgi:hypothetical protein